MIQRERVTHPKQLSGSGYLGQSLCISWPESRARLRHFTSKAIAEHVQTLFPCLHRAKAASICNKINSHVCTARRAKSWFLQSSPSKKEFSTLIAAFYLFLLGIFTPSTRDTRDPNQSIAAWDDATFQTENPISIKKSTLAGDNLKLSREMDGTMREWEFLIIDNSVRLKPVSVISEKSSNASVSQEATQNWLISEARMCWKRFIN